MADIAIGAVADGSVTTAKLADGAVTNIKVNSGAGIALSKLERLIQDAELAVNGILTTWTFATAYSVAPSVAADHMKAGVNDPTAGSEHSSLGNKSTTSVKMNTNVSTNSNVSLIAVGAP